MARPSLTSLLKPFYGFAKIWAAQFALAQNPKVLMDVRYLQLIWHDDYLSWLAINSRFHGRYRLQEVDLRTIQLTRRYLSE
jgi:hypothetical protein